ncbi:hypothetical protein N7537_007865 [Penicillium hordei]|uniref:Uncharacterized protein n=1 Tax=Penicillium hordei TaxID=40994 RepID=A0AAD6E0I7_9EURO|nr:uncharacterized protein N7537_007865 [Penicillium hordei]KAJ5597781.1 hypothetical protein N7537_007865 [Penicillium hordei]
MCQRLIETVEHRCGCRIDSPGSVIELNGCNNCGIIKRTQQMGKMTKRDPCPDSIANGFWVKRNGKWEKA